MTPDPSKTQPAPTPEDLKKSMDDIPDGPNIESSPWELKAARGETPLEGPRAEADDADHDADDPQNPIEPRRP
jgi:hypothetical protein